MRPAYKTFKRIDSVETGRRAREERKKYEVPWRLCARSMGPVNKSFFFSLERGDKTWNQNHIAGFNEAVTEWRKRDA